MKKILVLTCILGLLPLQNNVFALSEDIIKKSTLIEKYVINHKKKITLFAQKYNIKNNTLVNSRLQRLNDLILALEKIKVSNISDNEGSKKLTIILEEVKKINSELKTTLQNEKDKYERAVIKEKGKYAQIGSDLSLRLNKIIIILAKNLPKQQLTPEKRSSIIQHLRNLEQQSNRLKEIKSTDFISTDSIKSEFIEILQRIKSELIQIKKLQS